MALIYIVEDDSNIQEIEEYALKNAGHSTRTFSDGASLFQEMKTALPDLIVLDIMLPDMNGNEILSQIKSDKRTKSIPVVMVTAKTAEIDAVRSFDYGADEYIRKPFSLMEYISRINRLLKEDEDDADKVLGDIRIDMKKHQAYVHEEEVALTYKEFELLLLLVKNCGIVLSREKILEKVWGYDYEGESRTLDMHIVSLRQKIAASKHKIRTVRNVGYVIE